jgi:hypothetical protein
MYKYTGINIMKISRLLSKLSRKSHSGFLPSQNDYTRAVGTWADRVPTPCPGHRGGGTRGKRPANTQTGQSCLAPRVPPHIPLRHHRRPPGPAPSQGGAPGDGASRPSPAPPGPDNGPEQPSVKENKKFKHQS